MNAFSLAEQIITLFIKVDNLQIIHFNLKIKLLICFFKKICYNFTSSINIIFLKKELNIMGAIDYKKYSNMTKRQLLNSLINAEKKEQKLKEEAEKKINETKELIQFLKAKMIKSLDDKPKYQFFTREQTNLDEISKKVTEQISIEEQKQLEAELQKDITGDLSQ